MLCKLMLFVTFTVSIVKVKHHHDGNQTVISACDMIRICFRQNNKSMVVTFLRCTLQI